MATLPSAKFSNHKRYRFQICIAQIGDLNEDCVKISHPYLLYFTINNRSESVTVGPDHRFK